MNLLLTEEVQRYLREHEHDDEREFVLRGKPVHGVPPAVIANQIAGRRKAREKLPIFYQTKNIVYPPIVNLEQASSQATAVLKQRLVRDWLGPENPGISNGVDLTGGFGVDSFFLSDLFLAFHHVEPNAELVEIAENNHSQLGAGTIIYHNTTAEEFLKGLSSPISFIYADPSRRLFGKRTAALNEAQPDISALQPEIFNKTRHLLVKLSPLLDIKEALRQIQFVRDVVVVSVGNEVRELLFHCLTGFSGEPSIRAINISDQHEERFEFQLSQESEAKIEYGDPAKFLYEPNAAILKAGAFKTIANRFGLRKIHPNTHLYTGAEFINDFPGRVFSIEEHIRLDKRLIQQRFPSGRANVITRNYPLHVDELKRKAGLVDGGNDYLIGFSALRRKFTVVASRLK